MVSTSLAYTSLLSFYFITLRLKVNSPYNSLIFLAIFIPSSRILPLFSVCVKIFLLLLCNIRSFRSTVLLILTFVGYIFAVLQH